MRCLLELPHHPHPTSAHSCPHLHLLLQAQVKEVFCYPPLKITDLFSLLNSSSLTHMTTINNYLKRYARNILTVKNIRNEVEMEANSFFI